MQNEDAKDLAERLDKLGEKLSSKEAKQPPKSSARADLSYAFKISADLIAGVLVGVLVGYYLDKWLSTQPLFFIICILFGMLGGIYNIYKHLNGSTQYN